MQDKPASYLAPLRDQMAASFDLEELRALAFDLGLDWDELHGGRKTARVQDMITQLARNGRLDDLISSLRKERPGQTWPDVPPPAQQQRDIRTAFPGRPFYQQTWVWGLENMRLERDSLLTEIRCCHLENESCRLLGLGLAGCADLLLDQVDP